MPDPTNPADQTRDQLAEAVRQITRLNDLLARQGGGAAAPPPAPPGSGDSPPPPAPDFAGLTDVTNYTFHTPAAVGSRVTVRRIADPGTGAQLRAAGQAYAHGLTDLLDADGLTVGPVDTLPSGGEYVVVTGRLPPEPGQGGGGAVVRSALVRLASGPVNVEFVARADDPAAADQFAEILRTLRPAPAADPVAAAFASVAGASAGPTRPAGPVAFDLPPAFRGPAAATFASPDRGVRFEVALAAAPAGPPPADSPLLGALAAATGDDGRRVLYELPPTDVPMPAAAAAATGGTAAGGFEAARPHAAQEATREVELNGRKVRVTGVAGDAAAAEALVRAALARVTPGPK